MVSPLTNPSLITPITFTTPAADPAWNEVRQLFGQQIAAGLHPGAQLVVLHHGQVVVDEAAGIAQRRAATPVTPDTLFMTLSVTKAFTAVCVHKLIEDGRLELDAPVATYWPAFGRRGKAEVTLRQVLTHQAGLPQRGLYAHIPLWPFWPLVTRAVAVSRLEHPPGRHIAYHPMNFGFILGEVVRRVTGQALARYLATTFLEPLGLRHTSLGLPRRPAYPVAGLYSDDPRQRMVAALFGARIIRRAPLPAASLHSTARDIAIFYQMLLNEGMYAGRHYLQPTTLAAATQIAAEGRDRTLGIRMRWGLGLHLGGNLNPKSPVGNGMGWGSSAASFGHFGHNSSMTWADRRAQLVVVFLANQLRNRLESAQRWQALSDAIWDAAAC